MSFCWIFYTQYLYGRLTCVIIEKEKSTSEISSLLSTIRERLLLAKSASPKVKGYLLMLYIKKSAPMSRNYWEKRFCPPQSSRSHWNQRLIVNDEAFKGNRKLPVNVRKGNFDDYVYVVEQSHLDFGQDVNRTPTRSKSGLKRTLVEEYEDEVGMKWLHFRNSGVPSSDFCYPDYKNLITSRIFAIEA